MLVRFVIGFIGLAMLGRILVHEMPEVRNLEAQQTELQSQIAQLEDSAAEEEEALDMISESGSDYLSNLKIAEMMDGLEGASLTEITAYALDGNGFRYELLTTDSINDVNFFTEQVDQMSFTFYVSDSRLFMAQVAEMVAHIDRIEVSSDHAMILIPTVFGNYN